MPNKNSFPVFLTIIRRASAFGSTGSLVPASRQSLILLFKTRFLPTLMLILPMLNAFSCFFSECFNRADASNVPIPQNDVSFSLSLLSYSSDEIQSLIRKLRNNSAAGIDGITCQMLKHTTSSISPILCRIFNLLLYTGRIPDAWKLSRVFSRLVIPCSHQLQAHFTPTYLR